VEGALAPASTATVANSDRDGAGEPSVATAAADARIQARVAAVQLALAQVDDVTSSRRRRHDNHKVSADGHQGINNDDEDEEEYQPKKKTAASRQASATKKKRGKKAAGESSSSSDDSDDSNDDDDSDDENRNLSGFHRSRRPKVTLCGTCGCRIAPKLLVCHNCRSAAAQSTAGTTVRCFCLFFSLSLSLSLS
jgi:hypothetical protein